jgi:hypothetical protein
MCQGFFAKEQKQELKEWRRVRSLGWNIICGYADHTKLPANQMDWWPMEGDIMPKTRKISKARTQKLAERIKQELAKGG